MEASFWTTMESHPQQAPLGIINMLISRRTLIDSISRSLEVLYEMPYTTEFPPGLPPDLEQLLRDLHASTERLMDEVTRTNRLLHRLAMFPPHALPTQPWLPDGAALPQFPPPYGPAAPSSRTLGLTWGHLTPYFLSVFRRVFDRKQEVSNFAAVCFAQFECHSFCPSSLIFSHFPTCAAFCFRISTSPHFEPLPALHGSSSYGSFGWFYGSTTT